MVYNGGLKAGWAKAILDAQTQIANEISRIKLPFITIHGTDDQMVDIASSQFLYDNAQSEDKTFEVCIKYLITFSLEYYQCQFMCMQWEVGRKLVGY